MKLTRNEIFKINSVISSLEIINNNSDNLIQAINSFTEDNNLKGRTYYLLKIYWETNYFNTIKNIQNSISSYKESINKVKSELELFLDGYEILDTAHLPKLERRVSYYETLISELSKTGISSSDFSLINSYQNAISIYRKHINKLKMLPSKNSECESLLDNFSEEMNSLTKNITNLTNWFSDRTFYDEYSNFLFNTYLDIEPQLISGKFKNIFSEYEINFINEFINNARDNATTSRGKFLAVTTSAQYILGIYGYKMPYVMDGWKGKSLSSGIPIDMELGRKGLDCSGFVQWGILNSGAVVPKTLGTSTIETFCRKGKCGYKYKIEEGSSYFYKKKNDTIEKYEIQEGDLILRRGDHGGHVGIITDIKYDDNNNIKSYLVLEEKNSNEGLVYTEYDSNFNGLNGKKGWHRKGMTTTVVNYDEFVETYMQSDKIKLIKLNENNEVETFYKTE